jgi:hypothetical protein
VDDSLLNFRDLLSEIDKALKESKNVEDGQLSMSAFAWFGTSSRPLVEETSPERL